MPLKLLSVALFFFSSFLNASEMSFPGESVKSISVSISKGLVSINGAGTNKDVLVVIKDLKPGPESVKCIKKMGLDGSELAVSVNNENGLFQKAPCEFEVAITFNSKTLTNPGSLIRIRTSSGAVKLSNVSSDLDLVTASGNIDVESLELRNVNVKTATGTQDFSFKTCPKRADLDVVTATGPINVKMPGTCKMKVDFKSAAGKLFNPIGESADYLVKINVTSASGDLTFAKF